MYIVIEIIHCHQLYTTAIFFSQTSNRYYLKTLGKILKTLNKLRPQAFPVSTFHTLQFPHSLCPHNLVMQTILQTQPKKIKTEIFEATDTNFIKAKGIRKITKEYSSHLIHQQASP